MVSVPFLCLRGVCADGGNAKMGSSKVIEFPPAYLGIFDFRIHLAGCEKLKQPPSVPVVHGCCSGQLAPAEVPDLSSRYLWS